MDTTHTRSRRLTLLPVEERPVPGRPSVRRYRLGRVIDDLGAAVAAPRPTPRDGPVPPARP